MTEMQDALRSCMEKLLIAREEREQIIVEVASEISSEQKKVRDLQHKLEDANKKAAKLVAENNGLCKAVDAKDKLIRELKESKSVSDKKLIDTKAKLDAAQKQCASLQYEVHMLQKELEIRSQEREYDLKSVDAAHRQQMENLKKIAQLEGECQRLRTMVRKRLPGPAALAKMRDEVEQTGASPRGSRSATPMSPRSVTPMSPRSVTPMSSRSMTPRRTSEPESYTVKLRAVEDENKVLKQMLAKRDTELQFVQMNYADEACKLSVVQRQLKELTEENKQLSDANGQSESWASALISELEHFRAEKQGASVMASNMSFLDDFAEIEKLEMASGDQALRPSHASPKKADSRSVMSEKNSKDPVQNGILSNGRPEWVQNIQELVIHKHEANGESIDTILQEIRRALDQSDSQAKGDSDVLYDPIKIEKMVTNLIEKITSMIRRSAEDNVAKCGSLLDDKSEFCARLEYLVHICYDLLHGKANLEMFVDEVCLTLEYIVSQYCSSQDPSGTAQANTTKNFDGDESLSTVNAHSEHDVQSAKIVAPLDIQTEEHKEPIQSVAGQIPDHILVNHQESQLNEELSRLILDQDDNIHPWRKSSYREIESPAGDGSMEELTEQKEKQLTTNLEISAAADKLAECQQTITNLSRQLHGLQSTANSGTLDSSVFNPRLSSAKSDYKPQSLASILAEEDPKTEGSSSPTPKDVHSKKEHDEPDAAPERSIAQEQNPDAALNGDDEESTQIVVRSVFPEPQQEAISADLRKKRSPSLLGRIIFRKKVEGGF